MICKFCPNDATHLAAQSEDAGKTVSFVAICADEIKTWNDGGDWKAPIYEIGRNVG